MISRFCRIVCVFLFFFLRIQLVSISKVRFGVAKFVSSLFVAKNVNSQEQAGITSAEVTS